MSIRAPGVEGNFEVLAGHLPFLTALDVGEIRLRESETPQLMAISGGVFEVLRQVLRHWSRQRNGHRRLMWNALRTPAIGARRLTSNVPDLNRPQAEAALARAKTASKSRAICNYDLCYSLAGALYSILIKQHAHQRTPESSASKPQLARARLWESRQEIYQASRLQQDVELGFQLARECQQKLRCRASRGNLGR